MSDTNDTVQILEELKERGKHGALKFLSEADVPDDMKAEIYVSYKETKQEKRKILIKEITALTLFITSCILGKISISGEDVPDEFKKFVAILLFTEMIFLVTALIVLNYARQSITEKHPYWKTYHTWYKDHLIKQYLEKKEINEHAEDNEIHQ